jgi:pheromone shutdown protein TraB
MKNDIIKNGIFGGIIVSIVMLSMTYYMKINPKYEPSAIVGVSSMFFAFTFLFLGIKKQRDTNGGFISFGNAFKTGVLISLVISIIYVIIWLIVYYNFFPNFMEQYGEMVLRKTTPEDLAEKTAEINQMKEWYKNPIYIILLTLMEILPLGIVISLISALIMKKKQA